MSHRPEDVYEYVATQDIMSGTVRAFSAGDPVPADTVEALGLLDSGDAVHRDDYEPPEGDREDRPEVATRRGEMPPHLRGDEGKNKPEGDVAGTPANAGTGSSTDKAVASEGLFRPTADDNKAAWVDYASDDRNPDYLSREDANGMTKSALMERYK